MARFKRRAKSYRRIGKKSRSRRSRGSENAISLVLPAALYGAGRGYLSNLIQPLTSKIPLGGYADEAVLGVAGYFMAKKGRGLIKSLGKGMLVVEAASLGNSLVGSKIGGSVGGQSTNYGGWQ